MEAVDYVTKPFDPEDFALNVVGPIAQRRTLMKKFEEARAAAPAARQGARLVGTSLAMRQQTSRIALAAPGDASVVIVGDSGTGKKLVARTIHAQSPRRYGPLVVVPAAALPELALRCESPERPLYDDPRNEWFRAAEGGTLVLDGIERISISAQSNLLRLIEEPTAHARRSQEWQPVGVRLISLTTEQPAHLVAERAFLGPLFFRLNAMQLPVPSLYVRDGVLYVLVCHFLREFTPPGRGAPSLTPRAWRALSAYRFPGNVRELAWALEHAIANADVDEIDMDDLPDEVTQMRAGLAAFAP